MHCDYSGKTILITGGAKGIGRGISDAFGEAGAELVLCGRSEPEYLPRNAHFLAIDIRQADAPAELVDFALAKTGRLDCLINNAGGGPYVNSETASQKLTEKIFQLNLLAPFYLCQAAYAPLCETAGSIINIGSVSAVRPSPGTAAYGAAKAGLMNLTQSLAMEWAPNLRVNAIIAGLVETEASGEHYGGPDGIKKLSRALPMQRMARPDDIARACLFLADAANSYLSGALLEVYGGGEPPSFLRIAQEVVKE